jgi:hypothetical protein
LPSGSQMKGTITLSPNRSDNSLLSAKYVRESA